MAGTAQIYLSTLTQIECNTLNMQCSKQCYFLYLQGDGKDVKDAKEEAGPYWSLMFEVSESYCKPVNQKQIKLGGEEWSEIVKETITGAINTKLVSAEDQIVSIYHR